jgi:hypothetical protein
MSFGEQEVTFGLTTKVSLERELAVRSSMTNRHRLLAFRKCRGPRGTGG